MGLFALLDKWRSRAQASKKAAIVFWMTVCLLGLGLNSFLMGFVGHKLDYRVSLLWNILGMFCCTLLVTRRTKFEPWSKIYLWCLASGVCYAMADIGYYKLAQMGISVSTLGPATALYIIVPAFLGFTVLKEPMTKRKLLGIMLSVVAIYLLATSETESSTTTTTTQTTTPVQTTP